jgi:hypothetical protein
MAVRLFYELRLHDVPSDDLVARLTRQIEQTLAVLEKRQATDGAISQADIALTCMYRHLSECHPRIAPKGRYPAIEMHCAHFEAQQVFIDISQAFIAPA